MAENAIPKRAIAYTFYVALIDADSRPDLQTNPTLAAGDVTVSTDGSAFTDLDTLPVVTPGSSEAVKVDVSVAEMTGDNVTIRFIDQTATKEWDDLFIEIRPATRKLEDLAFPTSSGNSIDVAATGEVGLDFGNTVGSITGGELGVGSFAAGAIDAAAIANSAIDAATFTADAISAINFVQEGTADSGAADGTTLVDATVTDADDFWNGALLQIKDGTLAGQIRPIVDFANATGTFTVSPPFTSSVGTNTYGIGYSAYNMGEKRLTGLINNKQEGKIIYVETTGNDSNTGFIPDEAKLTVIGGLAAASAGDLVLVGQGSFSETAQVAIPAGVELRGSGIGVTDLDIQVNSTTAASIRTNTGSSLRHMTIHQDDESTSTNIQKGIGAGTGDAAFTEVVIEDLDVDFSYDGIFLGNSGVSNMIARRCRFRSAFDTVALNLGTSESWILAEDCTFEVDGTRYPSVSGAGATGRLYRVEQGRVFVTNCHGVISGCATENIGVGFISTSGISCSVSGGSIIATGTGAIAIEAAPGATVYVSGVAYDETLVTLNTGTLIIGPSAVDYSQVIDTSPTAGTNADALLNAAVSLPNNIVPGINNGLPTVDASNDIAGIQAGGIVAATFGAGAIDAAAIADNAIDAATFAADTNVYHADIRVTIDTSNDEYTITWFKDGVRVTSGITSPTIQVIKRADGTDLVASTAMTQIGSTGSYKYDEPTNRMTDGESVIAVTAATIDSGSRAFSAVLTRDV
jgi:hypothetical protein